MNRGHRQTVTVEQQDEGTYRAYYDTAKGDVTVAVALALEEVTGTDATAVIPRFTEYADPDALDQLFRERPDGERRHPESRVHLSIEGIGVTVHSDGVIDLDA